MTPYPTLTGFEPCRTTDPELWFPEPGDNAGAALARRLCAGCPSRQPCLEYALDQGWRLWGVFGGTGPKEREAIRRRRRVA